MPDGRGMRDREVGVLRGPQAESFFMLTGESCDSGTHRFRDGDPLANVKLGGGGPADARTTTRESDDFVIDGTKTVGPWSLRKQRWIEDIAVGVNRKVYEHL